MADPPDDALGCIGDMSMRITRARSGAVADTNADTDATSSHPDSAPVPYGPGPTAYDPGRYSEPDPINRDLDAMARDRRVPRDAGRALDHALDAAGAGDGQKDGDGDAVAVQAVTHGGLGCDALAECGHRKPSDGEKPIVTFASSVWLPEHEIDRLTRALAERNAECQAHMEHRYNAERERDRFGGEAAELLFALRNLWRIADDCGRCTNMDETERAFEVLAKHLASAPKADLSAGAVFSGPAEPSSRGLTKDEGEAYEAVLSESFGGTYDEEAGP